MLATARQGAARANEASPDARWHGSGHVDTGSYLSLKLSQSKCARGVCEVARKREVNDLDSRSRYEWGAATLDVRAGAYIQSYST